MCIGLNRENKRWILLVLIFTLTPFVQAQGIFDGLPENLDPQGRYLFFLHGQIVEDGGRRPVSERYGVYEYDEILQVLKNHGFVVISEARAEHADVMVYARKTLKQIKMLLDADVPPERITVVGASKGGAIAVMVSSKLQCRDVNYVLIATCAEMGIKAMVRQGVLLSGNVLSIYDKEDDLGLFSCRELFAASQGSSLGNTHELALRLGRGHGFHYSPVAEWMNPVAAWALSGGLGVELSKYRRLNEED